MYGIDINNFWLNGLVVFQIRLSYVLVGYSYTYYTALVTYMHTVSLGTANLIFLEIIIVQ